MYEIYEALACFLFGVVAAYMAVFWLSPVCSYVYGNYLHDGEKKDWSLPSCLVGKKFLFVKINGLDDSIFYAGLCFPIVSVILVRVTYKIALVSGMLIPYVLMGACSLWGVLYVARGVIRLNKRLDAHEKDKNAHV